MQQRTVKDTAIIGIPDEEVPAEAVTDGVVDLEAAPELREKLSTMGTMLAGSQGGARVYLFNHLRWTVTNRVEVLTFWQPCCTCDTCIGGRAKAIEYLDTYPGRWIAYCDMEYIQIRSSR